MNVDLRPARPGDASAAGDILWRAQDETPWMPELYSAAETIGYCGEMIDRGWVRVAVVSGRVVGFLARDGDEICGLYVAPGFRRRGIGGRMLRHEMADVPRLTLRVFAANTGAQAFYAAQGFVETGRGPGAGNDAGLPDISYCWGKETTP